MSTGVDPIQPHAEPHAALANTLRRGKGTRWMRIAVQCVAGAISAAAGGFVSLMTGGFAGAMSGAAGAWGESEQDGVNDLVKECLRVQREQIEDVASNVMQILTRLDLDDDETARRVESPEYQALLRRAFRQWTYVESEEKREYLRRLLTHAGDPRVKQDDFIRLFIDWIGRYSELHFRVMKVVYQNEGFSRADIWNELHGQGVREDSKEADIFKCLISDLSLGHVIRQERAKTGDGTFLKHKKAPRRPSAFMTSAFEDGKAYEMTEIGRQFVHFTMTELVSKLERR